MSNVTIILIAVGLAMDAFAVSVSSGITIRRMRARHALLIALFFGAFQAVMPVLGWLIGASARTIVSSFDHWIAFGLLVSIGGKMIYDARKNKDNGQAPFDPLNTWILLTLAVATSIDAFAVGISLSFLNVSIIRPVLVIGAITFAMSFVGAHIGNAFGHVFEKKLEILAGLVLIGIGCKILLEHLLS